jgi:tripartite-type tricarboxylate transporter receptor subunit TctC
VLPDVPAASETMPAMVAQLFTGLFVPSGTPQLVIDRLAAANKKAMTSDVFKKKLVDAGFEPMSDTPAEAQKFVDSELARLGPLITSTGFKPG